MADQTSTTPDPVSAPQAPRVPAVIAAVAGESKSSEPPAAKPPKEPPAPPPAPAAPAPQAPPAAASTVDALAAEKRAWAEQHAREKAQKRKNAPAAAKVAPPRQRPKVHTGWKVTSPIRFRNANGGEPEDRTVGDIVALDHFSDQDQASFLACSAIEAHFTEVGDEDDQVEPVDGDDEN